MNQSLFTDHDIARRRTFVGLGDEDRAAIALIKPLVTEGADRYTGVFFDFLAQLEEAAPLMRSQALLEDAKRRKREHLVAMAGGDYGPDYVAERVELGRLYSKVGLDPRVFLGAFRHMMRAMGDDIMKKFKSEPEKGFQAFMSLNKVAFFDIGIIVDILIDERERTISVQQEAIRELSTPVLRVRERLLIMPVIGVIDTQRAKQITDSILHAIRANRAKIVVMDVTGVAAVDSKVANHLLQTIAAASLMGTTVIVTGLSAQVAQSLVALGVDLSKVRTVGDLQGGLEMAERLIGYKIMFEEGTAKASGPV